MTMHRVVTLLPSATEIVAALDLGGEAVVFGSEDWPERARKAPACYRLGGSAQSPENSVVS